MVDCSLMNYGCNGGFATFSIDFLESDGLVSEACQPYKDTTGQCSYKCTDPNVPFTKYYCKRNSMRIMNNEEDIKQEIYDNGPVSATLEIFTDFYTYSSGIYT